MNQRIFTYGVLGGALIFAGFIAVDAGETHILPVLPARIIETHAQEFQPTVTPTPPWTIAQKIEEAQTMLEGMNLFVGPKEVVYYENRISTSTTGKIVSTKKRMAEEAKEIALALLNTKTGEIEIVVIKREGDIMITPVGYTIEVITRPSGIRWNYWNTHYKVTAPENMVVIGNRYPNVRTATTTERVRNKQGKMVNVSKTTRSIEYIYYAPYSEDLHDAELVEHGKTYLKNVVTQAFQTLGERGVMSRAVPSQRINAVTALKPEFFERLPLLEQSDLGEFVLDPAKTAERVLVILGSNQEDAYAKTCNGSGACGLTQFIASSYSAMRRVYPKANLMSDAKAGRADHINIMMASILHHDNVLKSLVDTFGEKILSDPKLEEYLAAGYNGNVLHVKRSLLATAKTPTVDWTRHLKRETLGFMVKLRFIRDNVSI